MKKILLKLLTLIFCITACLTLFVSCDDTEVEVVVSDSSSVGAGSEIIDGATGDDDTDNDDGGSNGGTGGGLVPGGTFEAH